jgi:hypothetical protein
MVSFFAASEFMLLVSHLQDEKNLRCPQTGIE